LTSAARRSSVHGSAGLAADAEDIFPDANAQSMAATWWTDPKTFERALAGTA
jgi:hypothetical protein